MAEPTGLTDIEGQEIDSNWDEVSFLPFKKEFWTNDNFFFFLDR